LGFLKYKFNQSYIGEIILKVTCISLPDELLKMAKKRASDNHESMASYIRRLIREDATFAREPCEFCGGQLFYKLTIGNGVKVPVCKKCHPL